MSSYCRRMTSTICTMQDHTVSGPIPSPGNPGNSGQFIRKNLASSPEPIAVRVCGWKASRKSVIACPCSGSHSP